MKTYTQESNVDVPKYQMTKFAPSSLLELLAISFPLMITAFSSNIMMFCDRIILARHSIDAMTAAFSSSLIFSAFAVFGFGVTSIAEVFVGQFNGKKALNRLSIPVWQMIWFSILFEVLIIPVAIFGNTWFLSQTLIAKGGYYFHIMMFGSGFMLLTGAVSAFFIGQGKTKIVTIAAVVSNVLNFILDVILISGIEGWFEALGATGAAIATIISMFIQFLILFLLFLSKENQKNFKTRKYSIDVSLFKECLRIGLPSAVSLLFEMIAWAVFAIMLSHINKDYVSALGISTSFFMLFTFFYDGLCKSITVIASNFIGANNRFLIKNLLNSAMLIHICIVTMVFVLLVVQQEFTLELFLNTNTMGKKVKPIVKIAFKGTFYFCIFDGIAWIISSILRAGGDTRFVMICNGFSIWLAIIISYIALYSNSTNASIVLLYIIPAYPLINSIILSYRYWYSNWLKLKI